MPQNTHQLSFTHFLAYNPRITIAYEVRRIKKPKAILHALGLVNSRMKRDSNSRRILPSHAFEACSLDRSDIHPLTIRATKSRANATFQL